MAKDKPLIVVYTMGKVASTAVSAALRSKKIACYDVHTLAAPRYIGILDMHLRSPDFEFVPPHLIQSLHVMNALRARADIKFISLIREPVGRNISAVFQNLPERLAGDEEQIVDRLQGYNPNVPDLWFRDDFIPATGIDVFDMDLDANVDHFRFRKDNVEALILKMDVDDERKSDLISDFLGERVTIAKKNAARDKWYARAYSSLSKDSRVLTRSFLNKCLNLRYFKTFYSPAERRKVAERYGYEGKI